MIVTGAQAPQDENTRTIFETAILKTKVYSDATYTYLCKASPATALTAASWYIRRVDADGSSTYADGNVYFDNTATNLSTVQGHSYS